MSHILPTYSWRVGLEIREQVRWQLWQICWRRRFYQGEPRMCPCFYVHYGTGAASAYGKKRGGLKYGWKKKLLDIRQFGWKWHIHQWLNEHVVKWCFSYSFKNKKIPLKKYSDILIPSHTQYILKSSISYLFIYLFKLYLSYYTKSESKFLWSTSGTIFKVDKTIFSGFLPYISCYSLWLYFILATNVF